MRIHTFLAAGVAASMLVSTAQAGEVYRYVTDAGTIAFTDEAERVPERYRAVAKKIELPSMQSYARYTPLDPAAYAAQAERLAARIDRLRELNAALDYQSAAAGVSAASGPVAAGPVVRIPTGDADDPAIEIPINFLSGTEPIVVEKKRLLDEDQDFTQHVTIIRQGDRILAIVKPRDHFGGPFDYSVQDLEDEGRRP